MGKREHKNICPYCRGRLDSGEKCDCRRMNGRPYSNIEGAGYRVQAIGYQGKR